MPISFEDIESSKRNFIVKARKPLNHSLKIITLFATSLCDFNHFDKALSTFFRAFAKLTMRLTQIEIIFRNYAVIWLIASFSQEFDTCVAQKRNQAIELHEPYKELKRNHEATIHLWQLRL